MTPDELRAAMQRLGMNAAQLAAYLRLGKGGRSTVHKWLRGERPISGPVEAAVEEKLKSADCTCTGR